MVEVYNMAMHAGMAAKVLITGPVNEDSVTELTADLANVKAAGYDKVVVQINSTGGSVTDGLAMYDLIAALNVETEAYIVGMCASAATYPALACDRVTMAANANFMVHEPEGGMGGDITQLEQSMEYFRGLRARVVAMYGAKTGMTPAEVEDLLSKPRFMDAQEALALKFVDAVEGEDVTAPAPTDTPAATNSLPQGVTDKHSMLDTCKQLGVAVINALTGKDDDTPQVDNALRDEVAKLRADLTAKEGMLANMQTQLTQLDTDIRERVAVEVANKLAALGVPADTLPAPRKVTNTAEDYKQGLANAYKSGGLKAAEAYIAAHNNS